MMADKRNYEMITETRERDILELIDNWDPKKKKFTREALKRRVECTLGFKISRQGMMKRDAILRAVERREKEIRGDKPPRAEADPLEIVLEKRVEDLQATVDKQAKEIAGYKDLFATYRYNARQLGITREQLESPIPARGQVEGARG